MKTDKSLKLVVAACFAIACASAWPQASGTVSAPTNPQAASGTVASGAAAPTGRKANLALRRKVYAAIGKDKDISAGDISVTARDGAVTLNGTVTEADQMGRAAAIARGVPGVTSVTNKLTVKKPLGGM